LKFFRFFFFSRFLRGASEWARLCFVNIASLSIDFDSFRFFSFLLLIFVLIVIYRIIPCRLLIHFVEQIEFSKQSREHLRSYFRSSTIFFSVKIFCKYRSIYLNVKQFLMRDEKKQRFFFFFFFLFTFVVFNKTFHLNFERTISAR